MPTFISYPYFGPNRRSDRRVVETLIQFDNDEQPPEGSEGPVLEALSAAGIPLDPSLLKTGSSNDPATQFGRLLAVIALSLQRSAGHAVEWVDAFFEVGRRRCIALVEHEDSITGMASVRLAIDLLSDAPGPGPEAVSRFIDIARSRALPRGTAAIIRALDRSGIPWLQPEREPLLGKMKVQSKLRPGALLIAGHGTHSELIDGIFCPGRADGRAKASEPGLRCLFDDTAKNVIPDDVMPDDAVLDEAAGRFVDWLYPDPAAATIPVISITGTNGKTSTSRMTAHIMAGAGYRPGLVCSDGIFINGELVSKGDSSTFLGHARVLTNKAVDAAVLEAHHRGIAVRGFAFRQCDVAVCLNVTPEHLAPGQIETLEEMAAIKRALPERGRCVVLNADNPSCRDMLPHLDPQRLCLYSSTRTAAELSDLSPDGTLFCTAELHDSDEWIVIHDGDVELPVVRVRDMPCSFDGAARFLVENAQAAISAAFLVGVAPERIAAAMASFKTGYETTPGRLNVYRDLPFTAVVDYAHNPDGMSRLVEFTDAMPVKGRRIMMLAGTGSRTDEIICETASAAAGHFDHYICRSYPRLRGRPLGEVPRIVQKALLDAGVPESATTVCDLAEKAREIALGMAREGDLLVMQLSSTEFNEVHGRLRAMQGGTS